MMGRKQLCPPQLVSLIRFPQPNSPGMITEWPRLLIGKSSVTPWSTGKKVICQIFKFIAYLLSNVLLSMHDTQGSRKVAFASVSRLQVFLDIHLEFCFRFCVNDRSILLGEEVVVISLGRRSRRFQAGKARATNRSRGQTRMRIGIPGTIRGNVATDIPKWFPIDRRSG